MALRSTWTETTDISLHHVVIDQTKETRKVSLVSLIRHTARGEGGGELLGV